MSKVTELARSLGTPISKVLTCNTVIAGSGEAATRVLELFGDRKLGGKVLVLAGGTSWMDRFPRYHRLGQSREGLSIEPGKFDSPKQLMTVEEYKREQVDRQFAAVDKFEGDRLDAIDTQLVAAQRIASRNLLLKCVNGTQVRCNRLIMCTGVGPERTLGNAGVRIQNTAVGLRALLNEVSTPLVSMERGGEQFKGKSVVVYGGGATGSWFNEWLASAKVRNLLWVGRDFLGANPNGRNNEIMKLTEDFRLQAAIELLKYSGSLDQPPKDGPGLELVLDVAGKKRQVKADYVVAAIGADPTAPLGFRSVLGALADELTPVFNLDRGFTAMTDDASVLVTSSVLSPDGTAWKYADTGHRLTWRELIETSYGSLAKENHVLAGLALTRKSAEAAVDVFEMTADEGT